MAGGKDEVIGRTYLVYCALAVSREAVERVGVLASGGSRMQAPWLPQFRARKKWAVAKCKKGFNLFTISKHVFFTYSEFTTTAEGSTAGPERSGEHPPPHPPTTLVIVP